MKTPMPISQFGLYHKPTILQKWSDMFCLLERYTIMFYCFSKTNSYLPIILLLKVFAAINVSRTKCDFLKIKH